MNKTVIIYWTGTGNTKIMAEKIKEGMPNADIFYVENIKPSEALKYNKIVLGCSAMGFENLEEEIFEPFFASLKNELENKKVALFGSYGWGDGSWMSKWEERVKKTKANLFNESLIIYSTPNTEEEDLCVAFGKKVNQF